MQLKNSSSCLLLACCALVCYHRLYAANCTNLRSFVSGACLHNCVGSTRSAVLRECLILCNQMTISRMAFLDWLHEVVNSLFSQSYDTCRDLIKIQPHWIHLLLEGYLRERYAEGRDILISAICCWRELLNVRKLATMGSQYKSSAQRETNHYIELNSS